MTAARSHGNCQRSEHGSLAVSSEQAAEDAYRSIKTETRMFIAQWDENALSPR